VALLKILRAVVREPDLALTVFPGQRLERKINGQGGDSAVVGLALRFALSAPPFGLHRASLRARQRRGKSKDKNRNRNRNKRKGDTSNELRKGTFLKSFDKGQHLT